MASIYDSLNQAKKMGEIFKAQSSGMASIVEKLTQLYSPLAIENITKAQSSGMASIAEKLTQLYSPSAIENITKAQSSGIASIAEKLTQLYSPSAIEKSLQYPNKMLKAIVEPLIQLQQPPQFIESMLYSVKRLSEIVEPLSKIQIDYSMFAQIGQSLREISIEDIDEELDDNYEENINNLSFAEKEELAVAVQDVISEPKNWQINLMNRLNKFKENNPILAKLFVWIINNIMIALLVGVSIGVIVYSITTKNDIKLREEPVKNSPIIITITKNQTIYIVNEKPYYYEIEFENIETREKFKGWSSKRSVKGQEDLDIQEEEKISE